MARKSNLGKVADAYSHFAYFISEEDKRIRAEQASKKQPVKGLSAEQVDEYYKQFLSSQLRPLAHAKGELNNPTFRLGLGIKSKWKTITDKGNAKKLYDQGYRESLSSKKGDNTTTISKKVEASGRVTYEHISYSDGAAPGEYITELPISVQFTPGHGVSVTRGGVAVRPNGDYAVKKETPKQEPKKTEKPNKETKKTFSRKGIVYIIIGTMILLLAVAIATGIIKNNDLPFNNTPGIENVGGTLPGDKGTGDHVTNNDKTQNNTGGQTGVNGDLVEENTSKPPKGSDTYEDVHKNTNSDLTAGTTNTEETPTETAPTTGGGPGGKPVVGDLIDKGYVNNSQEQGAGDMQDAAEEESPYTPAG